MAPPGKSQPPPRDARTDSSPAPVIEDTRLPSSRSMKAARDIRDLERSREREEDLARLKAEQAADVDDLAAMLVRVADTERLRDASEKRANGLEMWTQELEEKVAAARTRADDAEGSLGALRTENVELRAKLALLEVELSTMRRDQEDALELERVKRGLEIDALVSQHQAALAEAQLALASAGASGRAKAPADRLIALMEELERTEATAALSRKAVFDEAHRLASSDYATVPPPPLTQVSQSSPTMPPTTKNLKKRARRPSAPPLPPKPVEISPAHPESELETFADLDLGD